MSGRVPETQRSQLNKAARLYEDFTGHDPEVIDVVDSPPYPKVAAVMGDVLAIIYETVRDGVKEKYIHRFKASARPMLAVSPDGEQILLIGGNYDFTERGIVDRA